MSSSFAITGDPGPGSTPDREREIAALVNRFYGAVRSDSVLGPVFERHVDDWNAHLAKMCLFWSAAIYRNGGYSGRPLDAHRRIAEIRAEHFPRWLRLWRQTVDEVVESDAREPLKEIASRMASTMAARL